MIAPLAYRSRSCVASLDKTNAHSLLSASTSLPGDATATTVGAPDVVLPLGRIRLPLPPPDRPRDRPLCHRLGRYWGEGHERAERRRLGRPDIGIVCRQCPPQR